jgi:hypothetical protein
VSQRVAYVPPKQPTFNRVVPVLVGLAAHGHSFPFISHLSLLGHANHILIFLIVQLTTINMPPKQAAKKEIVKSTTLTQGEKKKLKQENKAKANPEKSAAKKEKADAKRERR